MHHKHRWHQRQPKAVLRPRKALLTLVTQHLVFHPPLISPYFLHQEPEYDLKVHIILKASVVFLKFLASIVISYIYEITLSKVSYRQQNLIHPVGQLVTVLRLTHHLILNLECQNLHHYEIVHCNLLTLYIFFGQFCIFH